MPGTFAVAFNCVVLSSVLSVMSAGLAQVIVGVDLTVKFAGFVVIVPDEFVNTAS